MNAFIAYRLPEEKEVWQHTELTEKLEEAQFICAPFELNKPAILFKDEAKKWSAPTTSLANYNMEVPFCMNKNQYAELFQQNQSLIHSGKLDKIIISRVLAHPLAKDQLPKLFNKLCQERTDALVYWIAHPNYGHWIGVSPETLLRKSGNTYQTISLAGTLVNGNRWTNKEYEEQNLVTNYIMDVLKQHQIAHFEKNGPATIRAGNVKHLKTIFNWNEETNIAALLNDLHPTPAVCGVPKQEAYDAIVNKEPHERKLYTGFIGPVNQHRTHLFVNLRCLQHINQTAYLYVGGGITSHSQLAHEWKETQHKANSLLSVIENL